MGGPPRMYLTEAQTCMVEKLAAVLTIPQMADFFNITGMTLATIMDRDPAVRLAYNKGRATAMAGVAKNLITQAMDGNTSAAIFYLKTQAGWRETQVIDNRSSDGSMSPTAAININTSDMRRLLKEIDDEC